MKIWIMRHGEASFNAPTDRERPLTKHGKQSAARQGKILGEYCLQSQISPDKILISPYLRAQQTAEHCIAGMQAAGLTPNFAAVTETWDEITPFGNSALVADYLHFLRKEGAQHVLIISHLPLVDDICYTLLRRPANVAFHPAVIAEITLENQHAELSRVLE